MTWDGGGTFDRVHNFSADASAGIQAQAARFDAEFDGFKTGLENCVTLTGETTPSANQPMGGFRHTGVAAAVSADNYLRADQNANQVAIYVRDTNSTASGIISASATIFPTSFTDGQRISVLVSASGSATANRVIVVNGLSANILDSDSSAVPAANMKRGGVYDLVYDSSAGGFKLLREGDGQAYKITVADTSGNFTATDLEGVLSELSSADIASSTDSFTATFSGFSSDPSSPTTYYQIQGNNVTVRFDFGTGTSNSSAMAITNVPSSLQVEIDQTVPIIGLIDNGGNPSWGSVQISGSNFFFNYEGLASNYTNSGTKGLESALGGATITYNTYLGTP